MMVLLMLSSKTSQTTRNRPDKVERGVFLTRPAPGPIPERTRTMRQSGPEQNPMRPSAFGRDRDVVVPHRDGLATIGVDLAKMPEATRERWMALPPSDRAEYLKWITEAKTSATRDTHIADLIDRLASESEAKR